MDVVKDLGYFVEIEVKKYDKEIKDEYIELLKVGKGLNFNLDNIVRQGYPYLIIKNN